MKSKIIIDYCIIVVYDNLQVMLLHAVIVIDDCKFTIDSQSVLDWCWIIYVGSIWLSLICKIAQQLRTDSPRIKFYIFHNS